MKNHSRLLAAGFLGLLAGIQVACAHTPAPNEAQRTRTAAAPEKVFVTGSHIAQRIDPKSGAPLTTSSVRVYSREQLYGTGRQGDLRSALGTLDPSVSP